MRASSTADRVSQAEQGPGSPAVLITTRETLAREVVERIEQLLPNAVRRRSPAAGRRS